HLPWFVSLLQVASLCISMQAHSLSWLLAGLVIDHDLLVSLNVYSVVTVRGVYQPLSSQCMQEQITSGRLACFLAKKAHGLLFFVHTQQVASSIFFTTQPSNNDQLPTINAT